MRQSSIIIHKGGREEKYEIYIEDYVMSFLKEETGTLDLSDFYFYGLRENDNRRYIIYGAGRDKGLSVFDKYSLLDELRIRLTQAGPIFLVREKDGVYEVKGYNIFYQENREMQNYMIERQQKNEDSGGAVSDKTVTHIYEDGINNKVSGSIISDSNTTVRNSTLHKSPHSAVSVQLCIILVALIAIVINSTNSYDKMTQLNQSASEVFFAIENQEAEDVAQTEDTREEIAVMRSEVQESEDVQPSEPDSDAAVSDIGQEDVLKLVSLENEEQAQGGEDNHQETEESTTTGETAQEGDTPDTDSDEQEKVEALSRNVARYYEVERGDTLYTISRKIYGDITYVQKICELNEITNPDHIRYGQKIILP